MKVLKILGIVVLVIILIVVAIPMFLPSEVTVTRTVQVAADDTTTYEFLVDYNNYREWNAWSKMDQDVKVSISGEPGVAGHQWSWDGDTVGVGTLTLKKMEPYSVIEGELVFISPMAGVGDDLWKLTSDGSMTTVEWAYHSQLGYFDRYFGLAMESFLGPMLEQGLQDMKTMLEAKSAMEKTEADMEMTEENENM